MYNIRKHITQIIIQAANHLLLLPAAYNRKKLKKHKSSPGRGYKFEINYG
jgi:hypothetical protein